MGRAVVVGAVIAVIVAGGLVAGAAAPADALGNVFCVAVIAPAPGAGLADSALPQAANRSVGAISASV